MRDVRRGQLLAATIGAVGGALLAIIATKAIPKMMSQMMPRMMQNMMAQMGNGDCSPAER